MRSHGVIATYHAGCRCVACREAAAVRQRDYRASRGYQRRPSTTGYPGEQDPMLWTEQAACRELPKTVFFPAHGGTHSYSPAKAVCASCEVRDDCLAYALRTRQPDGCWGGYGPDERFALERRTA